MKKLSKVALVGVMALSLTGCASIEVKTATKTVELGTSEKLRVEDFVSNKDTKDMKLELKVPDTFNELTTYKGKVTMKTWSGQKSEDIKVVVKDTTAPEFTKSLPAQIKVEQNAQGVKWESYFSKDMAKDLQEVTISVSGTDKVDLTKAGSYKVSVHAKDKSGNETQKEVEVMVVATEMVQKGEELTATTDNTIPVSESTETAVVTGKVVMDGKTTVNGKECKKGKYSTDEKQKAYEKKLAEEKKKKKEEEERKRREAERQRQQQQYSNSVYGGNSGSSGGITSTYTKPQTSGGNKTNTNKPQTSNKGNGNSGSGSSNANACDSHTRPNYYLGSKTFATKAEAVAYGEALADKDWSVTRYEVFPHEDYVCANGNYWYIVVYH